MRSQALCVHPVGTINVNLPGGSRYGESANGSPGYKNLDLVLSRNIRVSERFSVQVRAEAFNVFNHPNFNLPVETLDDPAFGTITSAMDPRQIQFGLKIRF